MIVNDLFRIHVLIIFLPLPVCVVFCSVLKKFNLLTFSHSNSSSSRTRIIVLVLVLFFFTLRFWFSFLICLTFHGLSRWGILFRMLWVNSRHFWLCSWFWLHWGVILMLAELSQLWILPLISFRCFHLKKLVLKY